MVHTLRAPGALPHRLSRAGAGAAAARWWGGRGSCRPAARRGRFVREFRHRTMVGTFYAGAPGPSRSSRSARSQAGDVLCIIEA